MTTALIPINYDGEQPTVSARALHTGLGIRSNFTTWFDRMCEYGFEEGKDFFPKLEESTGGRPSKEFEIQIDMAKQICMLQRSPEGKQIRQYFIDLEKAWNTPEQIMASGNGDSEAIRALLEAIFNWMRNGGLYKLLIDVLTNGVEFEFDNREIARLVKKYA